MIAAGLALAGSAVLVSSSLVSSAAPAPAPAQGQAATTPETHVPVLSATIVARYPHDRTAFTEGLLWHDGALYESTGQERQSDVRRVSLADGKILAKARIDPAQFGEGLALWKDQLVSLTWHDGIAHRWDVRTLKPKGQNRYTGEGWGLTSDGVSLLQSDGSPAIIVRDPLTLAERRRVAVTIDGRPLRDINELEYVHGALLANVWHTGFLVRIDPASGKVTAVIDLRPLVAEIAATDREAVLNGIAWDAKADRLFVTGKYWPTLFEIKIAAAPR
ncbi:glutaminyl-peptide cyclotransferase [Sphingomonas sp. PP-CE-1G-424]|uniref:glutaminyl-peptide cyclotransferase n=1 Tax=Sphingomonas sp. PP-CE-1G-424 TaxID=2135658 RepID=UPI001054CAE3|nr:glutaminyl-peptide cyclotransferase [Sphingomonas sp. PP-CE-1G-424]TCP72788.1 glutamine cyclotransferase [Sphingomonas sp. PP-CE-1G-424]